MENNDIVLKLENVSKSFGDKTVLKNIDLELKRGTIMGMIGKNGAGKTTLIKILLGLLKSDTGKATIFNKDSWDLGEIKHNIGYVAQQVDDFNGWMRVGSMLEYVGAFYKKWNKEKVDSLLKEWELDPSARFRDLSLGEKQKVAIIASMGHDPDLYILDEPVASLDPSSRRRFISELIDKNLDNNSTVLFSTHITSDIERIAADVAFVGDNQIKYCGGLSELKEKVVRLHIQSENNIKADDFNMLNILNVNISGKNATVAVKGIEPEIIAGLENSLQAKINVEQMSLEDIFLELS